MILLHGHSGTICIAGVFVANGAISEFTFIMREAVTATVPLAIAGVGELVAETAGVINIGIEGLMLAGCIAAYTAAAASANGYAGVAAAMVAAMALAMIFALVAIWCRADQIVTGTGLNLLAIGGSGAAWFAWQNFRENHNLPVHMPRHAGFVRLFIPALGRLPFIGPVLFQQYGLCYVGILLGAAVWATLRFTRLGLIIVSLGDAPAACEAAGIKVRAARAGCVLFAGACAGLAGAYLSIMRTHAFAPDMTGGQGFVVLALVIFGRWSVPGLFGGCLFFGCINALQQTLQAQRYSAHATLGILRHIPFPFFQMLPYVVALAALAFMSRQRAGPRFLGRPWPEQKRG